MKKNREKIWTREEGNVVIITGTHHIEKFCYTTLIKFGRYDKVVIKAVEKNMAKAEYLIKLLQNANIYVSNRELLPHPQLGEVHVITLKRLPTY